MENQLHPQGQFKAKPTGHWVSEYKPGQWKVEVKFNNGLYWTGYPTSAGQGPAFCDKAVRAMGFKGESLKDLSDMNALDKENEVFVTVGHETYTNKDGIQKTVAKVNFVDSEEWQGNAAEYTDDQLTKMDQISIGAEIPF